MSYSYSVQDARNIAEVAFAQMIKNGVPATPQNFEIWFAYAAGENQDLIARVDGVIKQGTGFTVSDTEALREKFFANSDHTRAMEAMGEEMEAAMGRVTESLKSAGENTSEYGEALSGVSGELGDATDPKAVKIMIDKLVTATKNMEQHSKVLETRLQESTEEVSTLRDNMEAIRTESLTDQLTGLANRRAFDETLHDAKEETLKEGTPLCLLMGDIDKFKAFNDTWGHQTGDQVLKLVAHCFKEAVKGRDTPARYGGEEFAVILPDTDLDGALAVAEEIRRMVESKKVVKRSTGETLGTITLSLGAAIFRSQEELTDLIERADTCLYAAKNAGRNRVMGEAEYKARNAA